MKNKTDSMNRGFGSEEASEGYERLPDSEMASTRDRKMRQMKWANLEDNEALLKYENLDGADEDMDGGFLPRNNYEDRY